MTVRVKTKLSRRALLKGAGATAGVLATPALAQNKDRIICGMTQEPVQFNPLLYANTGTENVPEACMFDAL
jgi:peptide/nickel transport system substrate-binding protein